MLNVPLSRIAQSSLIVVLNFVEIPPIVSHSFEMRLKFGLSEFDKQTFYLLSDQINRHCTRPTHFRLWRYSFAPNATE
jgi:hypothetical protein